MATRPTWGRPAAGRVLRRLVAAAVLVAATGGAPAGADPGPLGQLPQPCDQLAVSPAFTQDGTVFCAGTAMQGHTPVGLAVLVSSDRGRTWRKAPALGLPYRPGDALKAITVSPRFATDRTVFVAVRNEGVFMSTDAGDTFTPLVLLGTPLLTPYVATPAGAATARTMLLAVESVERKPAIIDPLTRSVQPVVGAPVPASDIVVSPSWAADRVALAFTDTGGVGKNVATVYRCSEAFDCTRRAAAFPPGYRYQRAWFAADFATSRTIFVQLVPEDISRNTPKLYVSRDGGRTFARLTGAQAVVDRHRQRHAAADEPVVALATGRPGSDRVWLRIYGSSTPSVPFAEVWRSDDNGRTWVRAAWGEITKRSSGPMPDLRIPPRPQQPRVLLEATADDHLFINGITAGGWGLGCSRNGGRTWSMMCR